MHDGGVLSQEKNVFVVAFTDGSKLILDSDNLLLLHDYFDDNKRTCFLVGRYIGESVVYKHTVFLAHIVRISPYFEPVPDTEPVGRATPEDLASKKPPFEVSGY